MKHEEDLAKGWLLKCDSDLANAKWTVSSAGSYDTGCFHAQQTAEKYLKGREGAVACFGGDGHELNCCVSTSEEGLKIIMYNAPSREGIIGSRVSHFRGFKVVDIYIGFIVLTLNLNFPFCASK